VGQSVSVPGPDDERFGWLANSSSLKARLSGSVVNLAGGSAGVMVCVLYTSLIASISHSGGTNTLAGPSIGPTMTSFGKYLFSGLSLFVSFSTVRRWFLVSEAFSVLDLAVLPGSSEMSSSDSSSDLLPPYSDKRGRSLNLRPPSGVPIPSLILICLFACV
jgi:hypothetical protein